MISHLPIVPKLCSFLSVENFDILIFKCTTLYTSKISKNTSLYPFIFLCFWSLLANIEYDFNDLSTLLTIIIIYNTMLATSQLENLRIDS